MSTLPHNTQRSVPWHSNDTTQLHVGAAKTCRDTGITVVETVEDLRAHVTELDALANASHDTSPQYESYALVAAFRYLQRGTPARVALIWDNNTDGKHSLIGAFPYRRNPHHLGFPFPVWSIWTHIHSFIATPHVRAGREDEAIRRFLAFAECSGAVLVRFPLLQADSIFSKALDVFLRKEGRAHAETDRHERAFLQSELDGEAYLQATMRKKKRKEFNRLWNRLNEEGKLSFVGHAGGDDTEAWIAQFLALEAGGWKGRRGTALAAHGNERAYFETICRQAKALSKLHCAELRLNGKPIAVLASFRTAVPGEGDGAYSFKIAFDEAFSKYSPGALLMLKAIDGFLADKTLAWVDSCAIPNHPMIDHIWAERRTIREVHVATTHVAGTFSVAYSAQMAKVLNFVWARTRHLYYHMLKGVNRG